MFGVLPYTQLYGVELLILTSALPEHYVSQTVLKRHGIKDSLVSELCIKSGHDISRKGTSSLDVSAMLVRCSRRKVDSSSCQVVACINGRAHSALPIDNEVIHGAMYREPGCVEC